MLFVGLFLSAACTKEPAAPTPSLLGRWNQEDGTFYGYNAQGQLLQTSPAPTSPPQFYLEITDLTIAHYSEVTGPNGFTQLIVPPSPYTRQGSILRYANGVELTIVELTANSLTLRSSKVVVVFEPLTGVQQRMSELHYRR
ncbi:hypothetical protein [Hymenobacter sp. BT188]|uniref:hypothetical protein n=1 Tax=Hymenobacter sp. BT188 TaxID=2763504 RepID=UPI0016518068|nr:hypothetical protein [Hymenobacter sp. BT188]